VSDAATDELRRIAVEVAQALWAADATLATAESCTGGMIAATLSAIPGASEFLWGGAVVYSEDAKMRLAAVPADVLHRYGPVSEATTEALAAGVRDAGACSFGLAVTGWAGPTAGLDGAVGEVHAALSHQGGVVARAWHFGGDRDAIRTAAAVATLGILRDHLRAAQDGADE